MMYVFISYPEHVEETCLTQNTGLANKCNQPSKFLAYLPNLYGEIGIRTFPAP